MQKLETRNTYTPMNTPQVHSNCDTGLNKEEILSVQNLKTVSNNPDVDQSESNRKQNTSVSVYVLNQRGNPLMPCSSRKARTKLTRRTKWLQETI